MISSTFLRRVAEPVETDGHLPLARFGDLDARGQRPGGAGPVDLRAGGDPDAALLDVPVEEALDAAVVDDPARCR